MPTELCLIYADTKKGMVLDFTEAGFGYFSVNQNLTSSDLWQTCMEAPF